MAEIGSDRGGCAIGSGEKKVVWIALSTNVEGDDHSSYSLDHVRNNAIRLARTLVVNVRPIFVNVECPEGDTCQRQISYSKTAKRSVE